MGLGLGLGLGMRMGMGIGALVGGMIGPLGARQDIVTWADFCLFYKMIFGRCPRKKVLKAREFRKFT